jgi:hypothetical protein
MADVHAPVALLGSTGRNARSSGFMRKDSLLKTSASEAWVVQGTVQAFNEALKLAPGMERWILLTSCNFQHIYGFDHSSETPTRGGAINSVVPVSKIQLLLARPRSWPFT